MAKKIYQIQIVLRDFKPKIWRRILVPSNLLLSDFNKIIQSAMGWTNSHLHQFEKNRTFYIEIYPDGELEERIDVVDYKKFKIESLLKIEKERIIYEYDFGDSWEHNIILEKILPFDSTMKSPVCISGKMHCPPEDCGGVGGYEDLLEILKHPEHEEYESTIEWLEDDFDPVYFDKNKANIRLSMPDFRCYEELD
jgi:hypothetical protein